MAAPEGKRWTREYVSRRVGAMAQIASIRPVEAADGPGRGSRIFQVRTGTGLCFDVMADRGLDLGQFYYKGNSLAWIAPGGESHPAFYEPEGLGWLRTFQGGLCVTCGLDQFGAPGSDGGEPLGLHGRASHLPARAVNCRTEWEGEAYVLEISGELRQARLFGENLVLRRRIRTHLGSNRIRLEDRVTNEGFTPWPHMMLYHFNLGFPLVSEGARLHLPAVMTFPRDKEAAAGLRTWSEITAPVPGFREQVFRHQVEPGSDGWACVEVHNPEVGLAFRLRYRPAELPHLFQWKQLGEGAYVLGIEPANSAAIEGRPVARERGDLEMLAPGESRSYTLDVEVAER